MNQNNSSRSTGLDFARSVAIFAVIWVHTTGIQSGAFGVHLFFMISGYLLANFSDNYSKGEFIFNRAMRLFPLATLMTLVFLFRYESVFEVSLSLLLINSLFTGVNTFPGGWSISNEWIYSWVNLLLKIHLNRKIVSLVILLLFGVFLDTLTFKNGEALGNFHSLAYLISYFAFFLTGNIFASVKIEDKFSLLRTKRILFLTIVLFSISFYLPTLFYFLVISSLFLACLAQREFREKWAAEIIHFVGKRTYGMFCGHFVILIGLTNTNLSEFLTNQIGFYFSGFIHFLIVSSGGLMLATFTYKFIEKPLILKSQRVIRWSRK